MKDLTKDTLEKYVLRGKLERNEPMTNDELQRLNAHNIDGIRIIVNTFFVIMIVIPALIGLIGGWIYMYNNQ